MVNSPPRRVKIDLYLILACKAFQYASEQTIQRIVLRP